MMEKPIARERDTRLQQVVANAEVVRQVVAHVKAWPPGEPLRDNLRVVSLRRDFLCEEGNGEIADCGDDVLVELHVVVDTIQVELAGRNGCSVQKRAVCGPDRIDNAKAIECIVMKCGGALSRRKRTIIAARSAQVAFVVGAKNSRDTGYVSRLQVSVAYWRDNQVPDQGTSVCQCLLDAASIPAVGDVELRGN